MKNTNSNINAEVIAVTQAEEDFIEVSKHYKTIDVITYWLRNFALISTIVFTMVVFMASFSILMLMVIDVLAKGFLIFAIINIVCTVTFVYLSLKMTNLNRLTMKESQKNFKACLLLFIVFIGIIFVYSQ